jgi:WD40 repeat protein
VLWNVAAGTALGAPLSNPVCEVTSVAFAGGGKTVAVGCADGKTVLWNVAAGTALGAPLSSRACGYVDSLAFAVGGMTLAVGCADGKTVLWNVAAGTAVGALLFSPACTVPNPFYGGPADTPVPVDSLAFAASGKTLAVGCAIGKTVLWNVAAGTALGAPLFSPACTVPSNSYVGPADTPVPVTSLAFAANGKTLAVGCANGKTVLWDVAAGTALGAALSSRACDQVDSLALAAGGKTLAAACKNGNTLLSNGILWTNNAGLQSEVCGLVWRRLTRAEWSTLAPGLPYRASCPS